MAEMKARVYGEITIMGYSDPIPWGKEDVDTVCESRSWLKEITPALVTLTEQGLITKFITTLDVEGIAE
jgi:hypothetical protein